MLRMDGGFAIEAGTWTGVDLVGRGSISLGQDLP
jgi:hypothetical protein